MAISSTHTTYMFDNLLRRPLEEKCTTLANLKPDIRNWFVRVFVSEKTPFRFLKWGRQQKLVFIDKELDKLLQLYKTYYIGNAKVKEITSNTPVFASAKYQMLLGRSTYIRLADEEEQLPTDHVYQLTTFAQCPELADMSRLSIRTLPNSTILFDPPIQQAELLKQWLQSNKEYIEIVVSQKLYDKANQEIDQPFDSQIRKISQILSLNEIVKSFWIKARITIKNSENCVYFLACPDCSKACGGAYKYEFMCFYCNHNFPSPKPLLRFQAELFDGTGNLHVYVEHKEASMLLCMSGEDVIEAEEKEIPFCPNIFNQKLKESQFFFQIRTSWNKARGKSFVRNTVIACLPASETSSASESHSYEDKGSTFKGEGLLRENVALSESQESSSAMQEEHFETDLKTQHVSITGKRRLDSKEKVLSESLKHVKQD